MISKGMKLKSLVIGATLGSCGLLSQSFAGDMQASVSQRQVPVLINLKENPVITVKVQAPDKDNAVIKSFELSFDKSIAPTEVEKVLLYQYDVESKKETLVGEVVPKKDQFSIPVKVEWLKALEFHVRVVMSPKASIDQFIDIVCPEIQTTLGKIVPEDKEPMKQRLGVAVRSAKEDNVDTYRIPGLGTSKKGTLLAIYDARYENARDLQGHIDIALNRSRDGGQTWQPLQIVLDQKEWGGLPEKFNGVSDAAVLVDEKSGAIYIAGLWMHGVLDGKTGQWIEGLTQESKDWNHQWRGKASQPGFSEKETSQFLITKSTDDGKTWSEPVNITSCKEKDWWLFAPAPGAGITMKDGTLVLPTQGRDANGLPFSNITYSKDGGKTWKTSKPSYTDTTECAVVELSDGSLMLNMRDNRNGKEKGEKNGRAIYITKDMGETWTEHPTSHGALNEPVCMASLHKHEYTDATGKKKSVLLFSNPNTKSGRHNMTVKASIDDGKTWKTVMLLDAGGSYGYSCLTSVCPNTIGILYEGSRAQMTFQRFPLKEVLACFE